MVGHWARKDGESDVLLIFYFPSLASGFFSFQAVVKPAVSSSKISVNLGNLILGTYKLQLEKSENLIICDEKTRNSDVETGSYPSRVMG